MMLMSLLTAAFAVFVSVIISFCLCCGKGYCLWLLPILCFFASAFVLVAVALYAGEVNEMFNNSDLLRPRLSNSYWLAIATCLIYGCSTVIGGFVVSTAKKSE